ncbi:MAG: hypothetical protein KDB82_08295 [Planctomycetes bacterium]|nr:hypothetical protein [Planctomycetota bacterium]
MRKAFDLRPLDFNDVVGRSFSLFMANFVGYLRWMLIMWLLPMLVVAVLFYFALEPFDWAGSTMRPQPSLLEPNHYSVYVWLLHLASVVFAFTTGASGIYYMTSRIYVGDNPSLNSVMRAVYSRFTHVAGTGFVHVMALVAITVGCIAPPVMMGKADSAGGAVLLGLLLWGGFIPIILWYNSTYGLNTVSVMLDDAESMETYGRSAYLTKRFRMRYAGIIFVSVLLVGAPGVPGLLSIPGIVAQNLLVDDAGTPLLGVVVGLMWDALLLPLFFIPPVVYYFDMRCRKESYDLAVMARNFGIAEGEMQRFRFNPHMGYVPKGWKGDPNRRRHKQVRKPNQRPAAVRHANAGMQVAQPWGPQPGMGAGFPGGQPNWGPPPGQQQWGPPQGPPQQWGPPQGPPQQWGPPPGQQWQNPQWGPPNPNPPSLPGVRRPPNYPNRNNRGGR